MRFFSVRLLIMLSTFSHFFLAIGQFTKPSEVEVSEEVVFRSFGLAHSIQPIEQGSVLELNCWNRYGFSDDPYLGITHDPSQDFNIYLSLHSSAESQVRISFDLSLNYVGIMNLRSRILLRKRRSD